MTRPDATCERADCSVKGDRCTPAGKTARGMCPKHYMRWKRHGDVTVGRVYPLCSVGGCQRRSTSESGICKGHRIATAPIGPLGLPQPLEARINVVGDCWEWQGSGHPSGHGYVSWDGRSQPVYRVVYRLLVGEFDEALQLDHLCKNPPCVNPSHLEPVTRLENLRRATLIGHFNAPTTCKRGHDWSVTPPYVSKRPGGKTSRRCSVCEKLLSKARRDRRRAA